MKVTSCGQEFKCHENLESSLMLRIRFQRYNNLFQYKTVIDSRVISLLSIDNKYYEYQDQP
jgi:hypothetical protein